MKKIFPIALIVAMLSLQVFSYANVIIQSDVLNQSSSEVLNNLSNQINSQYAIMELVNGAHDNKVYGTVVFGSYMQSNLNSDKTPLEWYIIEKRNGNAILISKNIIDSHAYDPKDNIEWNTSRLKKWMNETLINSIFSQYEKELVLSNPYRNAGRVFSLTKSEAEYYFYGEREYLLNAEPTAYTKASNVKGSNSYWLSDGYSVRTDRRKIESRDLSEKIGVRPCIVVRYTENPAVQALLQPETNVQAVSNASSQSAYNGMANGSAATLVPQSETAAPASIMLESDRVIIPYVYETEDDNGNSKKFSLQIKLPVYTGGEQSKTDLMNTLITTKCFEILKSYAADVIDEKINSISKQMMIVPDPITPIGEYEYSISFKMGGNYLCTIEFDLKTGTCVSES